MSTKQNDTFYEHQEEMKSNWENSKEYKILFERMSKADKSINELEFKAFIRNLLFEAIAEAHDAGYRKAEKKAKQEGIEIAIERINMMKDYRHDNFLGNIERYNGYNQTLNYVISNLKRKGLNERL